MSWLRRRVPKKSYQTGKTAPSPASRRAFKAKRALRKGIGINRTAKLVGLSNDTVSRLKAELAGRPFVGVAA
jgi:hypothetical protein